MALPDSDAAVFLDECVELSEGFFRAQRQARIELVSLPEYPKADTSNMRLGVLHENRVSIVDEPDVKLLRRSHRTAVLIIDQLDNHDDAAFLRFVHELTVWPAEDVDVECARLLFNLFLALLFLPAEVRHEESLLLLTHEIFGKVAINNSELAALESVLTCNEKSRSLQALNRVRLELGAFLSFELLDQAAFELIRGYEGKPLAFDQVRQFPKEQQDGRTGALKSSFGFEASEIRTAVKILRN